KQISPECQILMMTAHDDSKIAVEAMKAGAREYLTKPFEMDELVMLLKQAAKEQDLKSENKELKNQLKDRFSIENIIGKSGSMQAVLKMVDQVASKEVTVLVRGATGTGKELIAKALHYQSPRGQGPFVAINCGAMPENLLESELFGHEKGAFTGAVARKQGKFEIADKGAIFLDEIGEISLNIQVKLLRVLQEKEFSRVGGNEIIKTDARIIAATNKNLEKAIKSGDFREDLYFRLNIFPIIVPSLNERGEDIPLLIDFFINKFSNRNLKISTEAHRILIRYNWPGNIRELENTIERAVILCEGDEISTQHIPQHITNNINASPDSLIIPENGLSLEEVEKNLIVQALKKTQGNKSKAAELLGISRRSIYSKMETHKITSV
ncbi:MAG: sigma-54 dependent transcriptional regulator, partial [bacterium]